ncbi:ATP-dependent helicase HrpB [Candidatus Venteria ishoeyi]|uniref:ATP-dependent helicase HrpB n=1 Tax=Candidatus Venteria ishoeyi TaxID=1899563 RepID=UPI0025A58700|nr:ATP-dependent helicase HrpB [Candidatus Venteria ishoeyi]MDM8547453.1 ATP-dependent helicase HrpB [Candidatus Venteria ishoeyi]
MSSTLPIETILPDLKHNLAHESAVVLQAPPGAGKTTRIPLALLQENWLRGQSILLLEPRRLAARAVADYMANQLGEPVGKTVGYRIRLENKISADTRIEVVTEGILTRRLQQDPELQGVGLVIFDEYHERNLHADTALAFCLEAQQVLREDLKLLVMSATLDAGAVSQLLDNAPLLSSAGRSFPVSVSYHPPNHERQSIAAHMSRMLQQILSEQAGDILAFLPGAKEIHQVQTQLLNDLPANVSLHPLFGDLSHQAQQAAIQPAPTGQRKIVLATPIAETSLTIEGITVVVDSGWRRSPQFDPRSGLTRLTLQRISRAAAEQRRGRAGRLAPGHCYRLWSESQQNALASHTPAEISHADLAPLALELAQWGSAATDLRWLTPPPAGALAQAQQLLQQLGALDEQQQISAAGKALLQWGTHPRLAHMLATGQNLGWGELACDLTALLSERDILIHRQERDADMHPRLQALNLFRKQGRKAALQCGADPARCARVAQLAKHWRQKLKQKRQIPPEDAAGILLACAYPDRIAARRAAQNERYLLANGRGAQLTSAPAGADYLVAAALDAGQGEAWIHLAAPLQRSSFEQYLPALLETREDIGWNKHEGAIVAEEVLALGALRLETRILTDIPTTQRLAALLDGLRQNGLEVLPWTPDSRAWQARVQSLRLWFPEQNWLDCSDQALLENLEQWLAPWLNGMSRLSHLQKLDMLSILRNLLDWSQQQAVEQLAPSHYQVPSGSRLRLEYNPGASPVLAVRIQELFGLRENPRIANGKVPLCLHLLSPARRPVQITEDLANFWANTYTEVKKELKGRYPKHDWPDDPLRATALRGVRRKKT